MSARTTASEAEIDDGFVRELGGKLLASGALDELALQRAERAWRGSAERFDRVLTRLGLVPDPVLVATLGSVCGLQTISAAEMPSSPIEIEGVEGDYLRANRIVPVSMEAGRLVVAVDDPFATAHVAALSFLIECPVERRLAPSRELNAALSRLYGPGSGAVAGIGQAPAGSNAVATEDIARLKDAASEAPVIKLVQELIVRAVDRRASDIHVEARPDCLIVRFRIDGVLHTVERLPLALAPAVVTRIKVIGKLDIAERRLPQDGRVRSTVHGRDIDLRLSTMPTMAGESVVLRILDRSAIALDLPALGFSDVLRSGLSGALKRPHGIILVTGPTGSGKTTTLYAALRTLDRQASKIITVEDPIEYQLPEINQIQVHPGIGLTFASALRSILRQDPDVLMIGEIRDLETAQIAIQAALTGHLVLSTVHTNSAAATLTRLVDMGVERFLLASGVVAIVAQRLVRRLCRHCAKPADSVAPLLDRLRHEARLPDAGTRPCLALEPVGCQACFGTGYLGRTAIGEIMPLTTPVKRLLNAGASEQEVLSAAIEGGMRTMYQDGLQRMLAGETSLEEVLRATQAVD